MLDTFWFSEELKYLDVRYHPGQIGFMDATNKERQFYEQVTKFKKRFKVNIMYFEGQKEFFPCSVTYQRDEIGAEESVFCVEATGALIRWSEYVPKEYQREGGQKDEGLPVPFICYTYPDKLDEQLDKVGLPFIIVDDKKYGAWNDLVKLITYPYAPTCIVYNAADKRQLLVCLPEAINLKKLDHFKKELARAHQIVYGLKKGRRPSKWYVQKIFNEEFPKLREGGLNIAQACRRLSKKWVEKGYDIKPESIRRSYYSEWRKKHRKKKRTR